MYHFSYNLSFPPNIQSDSGLICGDEKKENTKVTNFIGLVSCPNCLSIIRKTRCIVCGCMIFLPNISKNNYYLSCDTHKEDAQLKTENFFKKNPDYTKWSTIGK
jgi:hypothetical protein